jgi:hypothetical protein
MTFGALPCRESTLPPIGGVIAYDLFGALPRNVFTLLWRGRVAREARGVG